MVSERPKKQTTKQETTQDYKRKLHYQYQPKWPKTRSVSLFGIKFHVQTISLVSFYLISYFALSWSHFRQCTTAKWSLERSMVTVVVHTKNDLKCLFCIQWWTYILRVFKRHSLLDKITSKHIGLLYFFSLFLYLNLIFFHFFVFSIIKHLILFYQNVIEFYDFNICLQIYHYLY